MGKMVELGSTVVYGKWPQPNAPRLHVETPLPGQCQDLAFLE